MVVGVLNVTPNSFSDGGDYVDVKAAVARGVEMVGEGAGMIDVGGESTRPGAERVVAEEQVMRVLPVIEGLRGVVDVEISIDTTRAVVAEAALLAGATVINDVSAGEDDGRMFEVAAKHGAGLILMHKKGEPGSMQDDPRYGDVVSEVREYLLRRAVGAEAAGVEHGNIILDPGIGFGKTAEHNWELLGNLGVFVETGYAVMLGASRKRFLGELLGSDDAKDRAVATAATTVMGVMAGVKYFRVHDVNENKEAMDVTWAGLRHRTPE